MHGSITPPEWYRKVTSWNITIILCLYIVLVNIIFMMMEKSAITREGKVYHDHDLLHDCLSTARIAIFFFRFSATDSGLTFLED